MTNFWFIVTATGLLIILVGFLLTPTAFFAVYLIGGALAATGPTVAVLHLMDRRHRG